MSKAFFGGRQLTTPTTASRVIDDAMANQNLSTSNNCAFIGESLGGEPGKILSFTNPAEAKRVLRGGNGLTAVMKAFAPSGDTNAPGTVFFIRAGAATQSMHVINDEANKPLIKLKSVNYGTKDNELRSRLEPGTRSGYRFTVMINSDYISSDNISSILFSIKSTADCKLSINSSKVSIKSTDTEPKVILDYAFNPGMTVSQLVDVINSTPGLSATLGKGSSNLKAENQADTLKEVEVKASTNFDITADTNALIRWINTYASTLITAELESTVLEISKPKAYGIKFFTGGTITPSTVSNYSDALDLLQSRPVKWLAVLSGADYIPAMVSAHVTYCSDSLGKERRGIVGTDLGVSNDIAAALARNIMDPRISLVNIGYHDYDQNGDLVLLPAYMSAALVAAMFAGVTPGEPLTNKSIRCFGLERTLIIPADTDDLIDSGVLCIAPDDEGVYKIIQSISTWTADSKYNRVEQSCGAALDATIEFVRKRVDSKRGSRGDGNTASQAASITQTALKECAKEAPSGPGYIVGDALNPAFKNIKATLEGDQVRIEFECSPVIPVNFVLVTVYASAYSGTASISNIG